MNRYLRPWAVPALSILVFFLAGIALIPQPGLQNDELFWASPLYSPDAAFYWITVGATRIPFMVMSYSGALKTWLYAALFEFFVPGRWSVRIPVLLMGMGVIWLTWVWVRRIAGPRAAAIATVLLATDTVFLLTDTFDWGPVALQHLLLMSGLGAFQTWLRGAARWPLALAFFLWGLGMWDKALLIWPLGALALAAICVFPREVMRRLRPAPTAIALLTFLLGATPLVWYNLDRNGETAAANANFTPEGIAAKFAVLRSTIDGTALYGYMLYEDAGANRRVPRTRVERASVWISTHFGNHRKNWMLPACLAALLGFPFLWGTPAFRPLLFLLIAIAVEWLQMALTKGAGGAAHHAILLWPFPLVFVGIAFSAVADRIPRFGAPAVAIAVAFLAATNLLATNRYLATFAVNGAAGGWTDAIYTLANSVESDTASWIGLVDWGYLTQLELLHEGDLPLFMADPGAPPAEIRRQIDDPRRLFIQHTDDKQIFPGVNDRFRQAAAAIGFAERLVRVVRDRNGRPVYEIFRFVPAPPPF